VSVADAEVEHAERPGSVTATLNRPLGRPSGLIPMITSSVA